MVQSRQYEPDAPARPAVGFDLAVVVLAGWWAFFGGVVDLPWRPILFFPSFVGGLVGGEF